MITCPKCARPVSGRARVCGYCGQSLVQDYFYRDTAVSSADDRLTPAGIAATALGVCGAAALLAALGFHLLALFGLGGRSYIPQLNAVWWVRTAAMTLLPAGLLVQQLLLRGRRQSLVPDAVWLFLAACALMIVVQAYLDAEAGYFYGVAWIPYLLVVGCALTLCGAVAGILACQTPQA